MKITANRKALAAALKTATVPAASGHLAILGGLHLDAVKGRGVSITGTNLDLTITTDVTADVDKDGTVVLPGRVLASLVDKAAGDTVTIEVTKEQASIECGSTVASLRTLRLDDWPQLATADGKHFEMSGPDVDRIARVMHAVAQGKQAENRPHIAGVHFVGNHAVGLDPHRLAVAQLGVDDLPGVTVPLEVMRRVVKASPGGLTVTFDQRSVTFDSADANVTWTSRFVVGEFVKYEQLIRKESPHQLTVQREAVIDALARVRLLADGDETHPVDFVRDGNLLQLRASQVDVGDICDEIGCTGDWMDPLRFHDGFLADLLANHDGDDVTFEIADALKPIIARSPDWRLLLLVMPVRIGANA